MRLTIEVSRERFPASLMRTDETLGSFLPSRFRSNSLALRELLERSLSLHESGHRARRVGDEVVGARRDLEGRRRGQGRVDEGDHVLLLLQREVLKLEERDLLLLRREIPRLHLWHTLIRLNKLLRCQSLFWDQRRGGTDLLRSQDERWRSRTKIILTARRVGRCVQLSRPSAVLARLAVRGGGGGGGRVPEI